MRLIEVRSREIRPLQIGVLEDGVIENCTPEVFCLEHRARDVRLLDPYPHQVQTRAIGVREVGPGEDRVCKIYVSEIHLANIVALKR